MTIIVQNTAGLSQQAWAAFSPVFLCLSQLSWSTSSLWTTSFLRSLMSTSSLWTTSLLRSSLSSTKLPTLATQHHNRHRHHSITLITIQPNTKQTLTSTVPLTSPILWLFYNFTNLSFINVVPILITSIKPLRAPSSRFACSLACFPWSSAQTEDQLFSTS